MSFKEINVSVIIQEKCNNSKEFKKSWDASQMEYVLPESKVTRAEGLAAFEELRKQAVEKNPIFPPIFQSIHPEI